MAADIREKRENATFLPGFRLADTLDATSDLGEALDGAEMLLVAVPTHGIRETLRRCESLIPRGIPVVSATKGIEQETLQFVNEMIASEVPWTESHFVALSGPSFAKEVAAGLPTVVVAAAKDLSLAAFAGVYAGALHTVVLRGNPGGPGDQAWAAALLGMRLRARITGPLMAEVGVEGLAPLVRHRFFDGNSGETVFQQSPVAVTAFAGVGLLFR
jgi:predicted dinucleotide-binding enzyme